MHAINTIMQEC